MLSSVQSHKQKGSDTTEHRLFELSASQLVRGLRSTTEQRALSKDQGRNAGLHSMQSLGAYGDTLQQRPTLRDGRCGAASRRADGVPRAPSVP